MIQGLRLLEDDALGAAAARVAAVASASTNLHHDLARPGLLCQRREPNVADRHPQVDLKPPCTIQNSLKIGEVFNRVGGFACPILKNMLIEIRLRPTGPWRAGHRTGDRERADAVYHSDALYSAVTHAMKSLGWLEEWLEATARAEGVLRRFASISARLPI